MNKFRWKREINSEISKVKATSFHQQIGLKCKEKNTWHTTCGA